MKITTHKEQDLNELRSAHLRGCSGQATKDAAGGRFGGTGEKDDGK